MDENKTEPVKVEKPRQESPSVIKAERVSYHEENGMRRPVFAISGAPAPKEGAQVTLDCKEFFLIGTVKCFVNDNVVLDNTEMKVKKNG